MTCGICGEDGHLERNGNHASCNALIRKADRTKVLKDNAPINKVSETMKGQLSKYQKVKTKFLRGKKCAAKFEHDCNASQGLTVHHMSGRTGYADEWARENEVPLLLDERFFLPACLNGHQYITDNSKWACENGYSFLRVSDPVFRKNSLVPTQKED